MIRDNYCRRHGRVFHGYRCPQCIEDDKKARFDELMRPLRESERTEEDLVLLQALMAQMKSAEVVKKTLDYELLVCPSCHESSLFHRLPKGEYSCLNGRCGLNSTLKLLRSRR